MLIIEQNKSSIVNTDYITNIHISGDNSRIKVEFANGSGCSIGMYGGTKCNQVLIDIANAYASGKKYFEMPQVDEVTITKRVTTR